MTIKDGFFNSVSGDRLYDAEDLNRMFQGIITDGVLTGFGDGFNVTSSSGMDVLVGSGKAWFQNTWLTLEPDLLVDIDAADGTYDRIDVVVLDFAPGVSDRVNTITLIKGTPAATPLVPSHSTGSGGHYQYPIAYVTVRAGTTDIIQTDIEMRVGYSETPACTGLMQQLSITDITSAWYSEFEAWMNSIEADIAALDNGDVFTELTFIRSMNEGPRNLVINGGFEILQRPDLYSLTGVLSGANFGVADRWVFQVNAGGTWTLSRPDYGGGEYSYKALCTAANPSLSAGSYVRFTQRMDGAQMAPVNHGTPDAKPVTISFWFRSNVGGYFAIEWNDIPNNKHCVTSWDNDTNDVWQFFEWTIPAQTDPNYEWTRGPGHKASLNLWIAAGSTYTGSYPNDWDTLTNAGRATGQTNGADTVNNYVEFRDIQIEVGTDATAFERRALPNILRDCQRFLEFWQEYHFQAFAESTTKLAFFGPNYAVPKRTNPTVSSPYGTLIPSGPTLSALNQYVGVDEDMKMIRPSLYFTPSAPVTANRSYIGLWTDITFFAEI